MSSAISCEISFLTFSQFAEAVILNMEEMHAESNKRAPLICFLSMGSDPTENIMLLAKKLNYREYHLTHYQTTNFGLFQTERICR